MFCVSVFVEQRAETGRGVSGQTKGAQQVAAMLRGGTPRGRHPRAAAPGPVERLPRPIADEHGAIAHPSRAIDILAAMERRGAITAEMLAAGEDFRATFRRAQLDPLRAADLQRIPGAGRGAGAGGFAETARDQIWRALLVLGGLELARRVLSVARCRAGIVVEAVGAKSGLVRAPRLAGRRLGDPDRRIGYAGRLLARRPA